MIYKTKQFDFQMCKDRKFDQFFVWNDKNIYVMDNHRAALWCWLNRLNKIPSTNLKVLHIDNHPDMSPAGLHCACANNVEFSTLSLKEYLNLKHNPKEKHFHGEVNEQVFSYQNFLRFFIQKYPNIIDSSDVYITQYHWETKPIIDPKFKRNLSKYIKDIDRSTDCSQSTARLYKTDLIKLFEKDQNSKWIVDLDFDYFYNEETNRLNIKLAKEVIQHIKEWYDKNKIIGLTIAWSPEFLINRKSETVIFGLEKAKQINSILSKIFKLDFPEL